VSSVEFNVSGGVARVTLNRPEKRNALDQGTIEALTAAFNACASDEAVRVVLLTGAGKIFCAGADLGEMQAQVSASESDNLSHARKLSNLLAVLDSLPKPTVARINGDGYGGALGLLAACDIVVAVDTAKFAFTEVRLGIIPAVISPFVIAKIGESAALRYFLTAETLTATKLESLGLVHEIVAAEALDSTCVAIVDALLKGAPKAQAEAKALIRQVAETKPAGRGSASAEAAARLARLRVQPEAQEGFAAFFSKRKPAWRLDK
jgi:methylglutaconyl-CoA hydratase